MKKMLLISGALLAVMASSAMASGLLGLHLGDCNGSSVINNNCTSNAGTLNLVASVQSPVPVPHYAALEFVLDLAQSGVSLSPWWDLSPAGCAGRNSNGVTTSFDFTAQDANGLPLFVACVDPWTGIGSGAIYYNTPSTGTGMGAASARINGVAAYNTGEDRPLAAGPTEYYMMFVKITKANSAGGGCLGCLTPTNIVLNSIKLIQPAGAPGGDTNVEGDGSGRQQLSYNGGSAPTATHNTSWGSIKALYR